MAHIQQMTNEMTECIQNCLDCYSVCVETAFYCLTLGGQHADPRHITLLNSCARICETSAAFMLSGSEFHKRLCGVCAEVCQACEDACSRMANGDETMERCAEACGACAESCQLMAAR